MFTMIKSVRPPTEFVPAVLLCALCLIVPAAVEAPAHERNAGRFSRRIVRRGVPQVHAAEK
jgi:hypothetical protein